MIDDCCALCVLRFTLCVVSRFVCCVVSFGDEAFVVCVVRCVLFVVT